jgi:thiol-disulfide isomerase/thioredoxin
MLLLGTIALAASIPAGRVIVNVSGMGDDCCEQQVATRLSGVPGVNAAVASAARGVACLSTSAAVDSGALAAALAGSDYGFVAASAAAACPDGLEPARKEAWDGAVGLDVRVISHGEQVDLGAHAAAGKFTVYDFGAPWCSPCFTTAARLGDYLRVNADVAVRVVTLDAGDPKQSFALPVVKQYLQFAEGLPWFKVIDLRGKPVYEGSDVEAAIRAIDKRRAR